MRKVVEYKSKADHYSADACIIWCFDDRFSSLLKEFKRASNFNHTDVVRVAGGAKGLSNPGQPYERDYVLSQIEKSLALHNAPKIVLMVHSGCGDYGKKFADREVEEQFYFEELDKAWTVVMEYLKNKRSKVKVLKYFANFDGVFKRD